MKAITRDRYGAADVLRFDDVEAPSIKPDEVLVRVRAAGLDPGVWHLMAGIPYVVRLVIGVRSPKNKVLGADLSGVVEAVGAKVTELRVGDEVFGVGEGSFAELARAKQIQLVRKPAGLSFEQAAAVPVSATTALQAMKLGQVRAGQRVLITGAGGGVGTFAIQLAKNLGAHVTGLCSTSKVELVRSLGADEIIDYTVRDAAAMPQRAYDVVIDIAGSRSVSVLREWLTPTGTLVIVGGENAGMWLGMRRQLQAVAIGLFTRQKLRMLISLVGKAELLELADHLTTGRLKPVISRRVTLGQTPSAIDSLSQWKSAGKTVVAI